MNKCIDCRRLTSWINHPKQTCAKPRSDNSNCTRCLCVCLCFYFFSVHKNERGVINLFWFFFILCDVPHSLLCGPKSKTHFYRWTTTILKTEINSPRSKTRHFREFNKLICYFLCALSVNLQKKKIKVEKRRELQSNIYIHNDFWHHNKSSTPILICREFILLLIFDGLFFSAKNFTLSQNKN